jgi:hypothetical protein
MSLKRIPRMAGWLLTALLLILAIALISSSSPSHFTNSP